MDFLSFEIEVFSIVEKLIVRVLKESRKLLCSLGKFRPLDVRNTRPILKYFQNLFESIYNEAVSVIP